VKDRNPVEYASAAEALRLIVLRGDGLTTTAIEILTGREIGIRLLGQRTVRVAENVREQSDQTTAYAGFRFDADGPLAGVQDLNVRAGEELLIRRVHLTDAAATVYAVGEVVAVLNRLPSAFAEVLLTTRTPLGKGLVAAGIAFTRELRRWGGYTVGGLAGTLGPMLEATSLVPGRTYRMVSLETHEPLAVITEWFAPRLFEHAGDDPKIP
jgi:chorismate-pyruvate lyase